MPSHAEVAAKLLRDAAGFFRNIGEQNEPLKDQMNENADVFEHLMFGDYVFMKKLDG